MEEVGTSTDKAFLLQQGAQQGMHGGAGVAAAADYGRRQGSAFFGAAESAVGRLSGSALQNPFLVDLVSAVRGAAKDRVTIRKLSPERIYFRVGEGSN